MSAGQCEHAGVRVPHISTLVETGLVAVVVVLAILSEGGSPRCTELTNITPVKLVKLVELVELTLAYILHHGEPVW